MTVLDSLAVVADRQTHL